MGLELELITEKNKGTQLGNGEVQKLRLNENRASKEITRLQNELRTFGVKYEELEKKLLYKKEKSRKLKKTLKKQNKEIGILKRGMAFDPIESHRIQSVNDNLISEVEMFKEELREKQKEVERVKNENKILEDSYKRISTELQKNKTEFATQEERWKQNFMIQVNAREELVKKKTKIIEKMKKMENEMEALRCGNPDSSQLPIRVKKEAGDECEDGKIDREDYERLERRYKEHVLIQLKAREKVMQESKNFQLELQAQKKLFNILQEKFKISEKTVETLKQKNPSGFEQALKIEELKFSLLEEKKKREKMKTNDVPDNSEDIEKLKNRISEVEGEKEKLQWELARVEDDLKKTNVQAEMNKLKLLSITTESKNFEKECYSLREKVLILQKESERLQKEFENVKNRDTELELSNQKKEIEKLKKLLLKKD